MPLKKLIYYSVLLVMLTSCNAIKNITNPASTSLQKISHPKSVNSTKQTANKKVQFLNDIEVAPGNTVKSQHVTKKDKHQQYPPVEVSQVKPTIALTDLETTNKLQLKYAVLLNVTVEQLNNIALLKKIDEWWGTNYCWGGTSKSCIDCSGFSSMLLQDVFNIKVPRIAQDQYNNSTKIYESELQEGDLVFFHGTAGIRRSHYISHVGVYLTNHKFVHASSSNGVTINDLNDEYYRKHFVGGGRVAVTSE